MWFKCVKQQIAQSWLFHFNNYLLSSSKKVISFLFIKDILFHDFISQFSRNYNDIVFLVVVVHLKLFLPNAYDLRFITVQVIVFIINQIDVSSSSFIVLKYELTALGSEFLILKGYDFRAFNKVPIATLNTLSWHQDLFLSNLLNQYISLKHFKVKFLNLNSAQFFNIECKNLESNTLFNFFVITTYLLFINLLMWTAWRMILYSFKQDVSGPAQVKSTKPLIVNEYVLLIFLIWIYVEFLYEIVFLDIIHY